MANTLASPTMGLQSFGRMEGGSPTAGMTPVWIASSDTNLMFRGDVVVSSTLSGANNSGAYITAAAAANGLVRGVFQGCYQYQPSAQRVIWSNYYNGSVTGSTGDIKAYIIDDPDALFLAQGSTTAAINSSMIGANIGFTLNSSTGNTVSGYSNVALTSSQVTASASLALRLVDFYSAYAAPGVPNIGTANFINGTDNTAAANMVIVRLNNCDRLSTTARST